MEFTAEEALAQLREGNERFASGKSRGTICTKERAAAPEATHPIAVVVSCSDSRVPTEIIFDVSPGDIWVIRSAGHVLGEPGLASVRFGVQQWGIPLVVVVGHDDCLAVQAAMSSEPPEWMRPVTDFIETGLAAHEEAADRSDRASLEQAVDAHVKASISALKTYLRILPPAERQPLIVGGTFSVSTGEVRWLD
jgi:carbonic anhydrase